MEIVDAISLLIKDPECSVSDLLKDIKGPDFPWRYDYGCRFHSLNLSKKEGKDNRSGQSQRLRNREEAHK